VTSWRWILWCCANGMFFALVAVIGANLLGVKSLTAIIAATLVMYAGRIGWIVHKANLREAENG
jgi:hypothetical protein